jgi:hypothetical protein
MLYNKFIALAFGDIDEFTEFRVLSALRYECVGLNGKLYFHCCWFVLNFRQ